MWYVECVCSVRNKTFREVMKVSGDLEKRIERLEDLQKLQDLAHSYCWLVDEGFDKQDLSYIDKLVNLFTEDCVCDYGNLSKAGGFEKIESRADLRRFLADYIFKNMESFRHYVQNFKADIHGKTAKFDYYLNFYGIIGGKPVMGSGAYLNECVKVGNEWKYKKMTVKFYVFNYVDAEWGKQKTLF